MSEDLWRPLRLNVTAAAMLAALSGGAAASDGAAAVVYRASFDNAVHHEARIDVTYREIGAAPLVLRMARSSPGRYALHEFARNVYDVAAVDGAGRALKIARDDPYSWRVGGHDGTVTVSYTLYADRADGTYSQIDISHAHLSMPATFMWADGFDDRPIDITFKPADRRWKVATQLAPKSGSMSFSAPNLQYFMDSPTELSDFVLREWRIGDGKDQQTIRLALHHDGGDGDADIFADQIEKVVAQEIAIMGEAPRFDYGVYTFLADYLPHVSGDGMEHRNSTSISSSKSLYEFEFAQIGTAAHEFFHAWNSERMRAAELEPFDFTRADPTPSLWFAEGFTSYYAPLTLRRAGLATTEKFLENVGGALSYVLNAPGRRSRSPQEMSLLAPFADAATANDPDNFANTFISYYPYGAVIGLALDLTLRGRFEAVTLDDYMRRMWAAHGETDRLYTAGDLRAALAATTGDAAFAEDFFRRYIETGDLPDFEPLLAQAGFALVAENEGAASAGDFAFEDDGESPVIASNPIKGSPLYDTGLERGDEIRKLGRLKIRNQNDWNKALKRFKPGDKTTIEFNSRTGARKTTLTLAEDNALAVRPFEDIGRDLTDAQKAFRDAWLGPDSVEAEH